MQCQHASVETEPNVHDCRVHVCVVVRDVFYLLIACYACLLFITVGTRLVCCRRRIDELQTEIWNNIVRPQCIALLHHLHRALAYLLTTDGSHSHWTCDQVVLYMMIGSRVAWPDYCSVQCSVIAPMTRWRAGSVGRLMTSRGFLFWLQLRH